MDVSGRTSLYTSTPASGNATGSFKFSDNDRSEISMVPQQKSSKAKSTYDLVIEAVEVNGLNRNGVSYYAIKKYIHDTRETEEPIRNSIIKKAVLKGVEMGVLGKSAKTKNAIGVMGCFILLKKQKVVKKPADGSEGVKKTRIRKQKESDSEAIPKKQGRPKKLNLILSDTTLKDPETIDKPKAKLVRQKAVKQNTEPVIEKSKVKEAKKPTVIKTDQAKPKKGRAQARNRKDVSDSEMVVKKPNRQSLKSYSSDTEVNTIKMDKTKIKNAQRTETKTAKTLAELPPKAPKATKTKRLYKAAEKQTESKDGTDMKVVRTRAKK